MAAKEMEHRQRLLPWLQQKVKTGAFGLMWICEEEQVFGIPWIHRNSQLWTEEYCQLFKEWARFTNSYKEGDQEDWIAWKTRIRTALNKLDCFERVKEKDFTSSTDIPYRVYKFVTKQKSESDKSSSAKKQKSDPEGAQCSLVQDFNSTSSLRQSYPLSGNIPKCVELPDLESSPLNQLPVVENSLSPMSQDGMVDYCTAQLHFQPPETLAMDNGRLSPGLDDLQTQDLIICDHLPSNELSHYLEEPKLEWKLEYKIFYFNKLVKEGYLSDMGVHFYFGPKPSHHFGEFHEKIFGPKDLKQIEFPNLSVLPIDDISPKQLQRLTEIQTQLDRGFLLKYQNKDIYAQRLCRSRINVKSELFKENLCLDRKSNLATNLFAWSEFQEKLNASPKLILAFAQEPLDNPKKQLCHMELTHLEATALQRKYFPTSPKPSLQFSELDSMDKKLKDLRLNQDKLDK